MLHAETNGRGFSEIGSVQRNAGKLRAAWQRKTTCRASEYDEIAAAWSVGLKLGMTSVECLQITYQYVKL